MACYWGWGWRGSLNVFIIKQQREISSVIFFFYFFGSQNLYFYRNRLKGNVQVSATEYPDTCANDC